MTGEGYIYLFGALLGAFALGSEVDAVVNYGKKENVWFVLIAFIAVLVLIRKLATL